ncbi:MAG: AEC family transporter [Steroidobacteraceae bacterium]
MTQFLLLSAALLAIATVVRRSPAADAIANSLNWWILYIALPALALELLPTLHFSGQLWFVVVAQWAMFLLSVVLVRWLGARLQWRRERIGAVIMLASLSNTAFIGLPLLDALRGSAAVSLGLLADQLGCFLALTIGGAVVGAAYSGERADVAGIARKVLLYPAFIAAIVGLALGPLGGWPAAVPPVLHKLSQTLSPLALFSVGLRLRLHARPDERGAVALTLAWKLVLMPAIVLACGHAFGVQGLPLTVGTLQSAMPAMFVAVIIIRRHGLESDLGDTALSLGMLLSFLTVPAWSLLLP